MKPVDALEPVYTYIKGHYGSKCFSLNVWRFPCHIYIVSRYNMAVVRGLNLPGVKDGAAGAL
jgi:hypothetical protein